MGRSCESAAPPGTVATNDTALMMAAAVQGPSVAYTLEPTAAPLVEAGLLPAAAAAEGLARGALAAALETSVAVILVRRRGAYLSAAARGLAGVLAAPPPTSGAY